MNTIYNHPCTNEELLTIALDRVNSNIKGKWLHVSSQFNNFDNDFEYYLEKPIYTEFKDKYGNINTGYITVIECEKSLFINKWEFSLLVISSEGHDKTVTKTNSGFHYTKTDNIKDHYLFNSRNAVVSCSKRNTLNKADWDLIVSITKTLKVDDFLNSGNVSPETKRDIVNNRITSDGGNVTFHDHDDLILFTEPDNSKVYTYLDVEPSEMFPDGKHKFLASNEQIDIAYNKIVK
ncbi:gp248 [Sphingomonas phage PAU]|uniref:gp248 n=1 Tax=Sphingomonas phage PAU TaxID=1150991 RepID=UPI00025733FE|nr:gp248 [Sphingomonas phage PAU]AFF28246.1 gp248 [Sphingomonas phage PAU]